MPKVEKSAEVGCLELSQETVGGHTHGAQPQSPVTQGWCGCIYEKVCPFATDKNKIVNSKIKNMGRNVTELNIE